MGASEGGQASRRARLEPTSLVVVRRVFGLVPDTRRRRRASDAVRLGLAAAGLLVVVAVTRAGWTTESRLVEAADDLPSWAASLSDLLFWASAAGVLLVGLLAAGVGRRLAVVRDVGLAVAAAAAIVMALRLVLGDDGGRPAGTDLSSSTAFPVLLVAVSVGAAAGMAPYLTRPTRRLVYGLVTVGVLCALPAGEAVVLSLLAALLVGWGAGAVVHLAVGSPAGFPSAAEIAEGVATLGVDLRDVAPLERQQWGVARFEGRDVDGQICDVAAYGRDAKDAQLLAKAWRFAWYRDAGPSLALTRLQQVEHEAVATLLAAGAGVAVPEVLAVGVSPLTEDALLVTRRPEAVALADRDGMALTDATMDDAWGQLDGLRSARIAHGAIDPWHLLADDDGGVHLVGFEDSSTSAPDDRLDADAAGLLVTLALEVGVERAAASAVRAIGADRLAGMLSHLQAPALSRATREALTRAKAFLKDVRAEAADAAGVEQPALAELRRVSWGTVLMVAGTLLGFWLLVSELTGLGDVWGTIAEAEWAWVAVAFVFSQSTQVAQAFALNGAVREPLPFLPVVMLQFGTAFTGLVGGTVANTAAYVRFFQGRGYEPSVAISSGITVSGAAFLVQATLLAICWPMVNQDFTFSGIGGSDSGSSDASGLLKLLVIGIVVVGVVAGLAFFLPRLRRQVIGRLKPQVQAATANLRGVFSEPRKMVRLLGGNLISQLLFATVIGLCLEAYGESASLPALIVINTLASLFGGLAPVPGGMGVVEAGLIAGLTAYGIPATQAAAATFTARLLTTYLPPAWGYFALVWLRRRDYL
jgi:uncharacterized membrane protein YbhN (UPF0104 family)